MGRKGVFTMNWSTSKSILLSRICVAIFALLLAALDLGAYWLVTWYIHLRGMAWQSGAGMIVTLYLCSIFGWVLLWQMWTLLNNIRRSEVEVSKLDMELCMQFRDKVNENDLVYHIYRNRDGKDQWSIICSAMDWNQNCY